MRLFALIGGWLVLAIFAVCGVAEIASKREPTGPSHWVDSWWMDAIGWLIILLFAIYGGWAMAYCLGYTRLPFWAA